MFDDLIKIAWESTLSVFGEGIEVIPRKGENFSVEGSYTDASDELESNFSKIKVLANVPRFKYMPIDRHIEVGDVVKIRGTLYRTEDKIHDGHGGFTFHIHKLTRKSDANKKRD